MIGDSTITWKSMFAQVRVISDGYWKYCGVTEGERKVLTVFSVIGIIYHPCIATCVSYITTFVCVHSTTMFRE